MRHRKRATTAAGFEEHFAKALLIVPAPVLGAKTLSRQAAMFTAKRGEMQWPTSHAI
jgi:hypothetical protein